MRSVLRLLIAAIINATPVIALADSGPITNYIAALRAQDHSKPEDEKIIDVGTDFCPIIRAQYDVDDNGEMDVLLSTSGCRATFWSSSYGGLNTFEMAGRRWVIFMQIGGEWVVKKGNDYDLEIRLLDRQMRKVPIEFCTLAAIESNTCKWSRIENDYRGLYRQRLNYNFPQPLDAKKVASYTQEYPLISRVIKSAGININRVYMRYVAKKKIRIDNSEHYVVHVPVYAYREFTSSGKDDYDDTFSLDSFIFIVNSRHQIVSSYFASEETNEWSMGTGFSIKGVEIGIEDLTLQSGAVTFSLVIRAGNNSRMISSDEEYKMIFVANKNSVVRVLNKLSVSSYFADRNVSDCVEGSSSTSVSTLSVLTSQTSEFFDLKEEWKVKDMLHRDTTEPYADSIDKDFKLDKEWSEGDCVQYFSERMESHIWKNVHGRYFRSQ